MTGTVVTFYSYKGGVGRTFALANTAATLCRWGYRTLCIDWDLDAPGLSFYLREWQALTPRAGLVNLIDDYVNGRHPTPADYAVSIELPGARERLDFIPAGQGDDDYVRLVQDLDWAELYRRWLGEFLEVCRARWKADYDFVLVDSRTGITDIGGVCTVQLPDVLVMLFTANEQSLRGILEVARRVTVAHNALPYDRAGLMIMPVPARFDAREEYWRAESWQQRFSVELSGLYRNWAARSVPVEALLGNLTIPYVSYWSFGEDLPALVESEPTPEKINYSLQALAAVIAHRLDKTELLAESRDSYVAAAARAGLREGSYRSDVFLSHGRRETELAQRIARELSRLSLRVFLAVEDAAVSRPTETQPLEAISDSRNLLVLVGAVFDKSQERDIYGFLRQAVDEGSDRRVLPVLAPGAQLGDQPTILGQFQAERMRDVSDEAVATLAYRLVRAISVEARTVSGTVREEARETLDDARAWRLDPIRWQLVEQGLDAVEHALRANDENTLRVAIADIELLGPVRSAGFGTKPIEAPESIRERVNELIHLLE